MSFISCVPANLLQKDKKEELKTFLFYLPIRFHVKKYTLLEFGKLFGIQITREDVDFLR
jgi:hypothetical protein